MYIGIQDTTYQGLDERNTGHQIAACEEVDAHNRNTLDTTHTNLLTYHRACLTYYRA
jgi:hypothetical protein